ncbi:unnamed protein product [Cercospora beticola]|nr:unnamed protein product [Cercospora beticola]
MPPPDGRAVTSGFKSEVARGASYNVSCCACPWVFMQAWPNAWTALFSSLAGRACRWPLSLATTAPGEVTRWYVAVVQDQCRAYCLALKLGVRASGESPTTTRCDGASCKAALPGSLLLLRTFARCSQTRRATTRIAAGEHAARCSSPVHEEGSHGVFDCCLSLEVEVEHSSRSHSRRRAEVRTNVVGFSQSINPPPSRIAAFLSRQLSLLCAAIERPALPPVNAAPCQTRSRPSVSVSSQLRHAAVRPAPHNVSYARRRGLSACTNRVGQQDSNRGRRNRSMLRSLLGGAPVQARHLFPRCS